MNPKHNSYKHMSLKRLKKHREELHAWGSSTARIDNIIAEKEIMKYASRRISMTSKSSFRTPRPSLTIYNTYRDSSKRPLQGGKVNPK